MKTETEKEMAVFDDILMCKLEKKCDNDQFHLECSAKVLAQELKVHINTIDKALKRLRQKGLINWPSMNKQYDIRDITLIPRYTDFLNIVKRCRDPDPLIRDMEIQRLIKSKESGQPRYLDRDIEPVFALDSSPKKKHRKVKSDNIPVIDGILTKYPKWVGGGNFKPN
jgi:hypothetical protein